MEKVPYLGKELTRWQVGNSTFLGMPEMGARLMNWHVTLGDGTVRDVLYWPEMTDLNDFAVVKGGNPVLFPFCGRTFDNGDIHFWKAADGVRRPMPIHGIARQSKFDVLRCDERGFAAQLILDDENRASYPFDYEFVVSYRFEPLKLSCEYTLRNLDTQPLPWSAGHHFYFTLPWNEGLARGDYAIRIPAGKTMKQDFTDGKLVEPGPKFKAEESMANPVLLDTFHTALTDNTVTFGPKTQPGQVSVKLGTSKVPEPDSLFVTWTLDDKVPYFCVEPWMGPPNAPTHGVGMHWVMPGQTQSFVVEVDVG
ncbi:aldose epimerase [Ereboglobus luteus]|uniref:Aldose epimerase n=1 Tax=Ereboglobus luteus TaxID=1796921 RepID=A0A2U8E5U7_9BACT|nr:aldose epimerase [Ereboglobus luteus]AWI10135.1 aldose epimerase [Ereboglobus luteus]